MSIHPQQLIGNEKQNAFIINKQFTDREEIRCNFFNKISKLSKSNHHVLNYFGMGGIGKTSLVRQIKSELLLKYDDIFYTSADFSNIHIQTPAKFLLELSNNFDNNDIKFYHFGFAYAIYFQKVNKDLIYKYDKHELFNENLGLVAEFLSIFDGLGILGIIPGVVNKLYDLSYNTLHLNNEIKNDLKELETMDAASVENMLPAFFAYDIKEFLKYNNKQIVIFLDSYEALWQNERNDITKFNKDLFIRELISHLPGVLFTICSREPLEWQIIDSDWKNIIELEPIENFPLHTADEFLKECKIVEKDIRDKMIKVSMGHPYYLNILVDTYTEMKNLGITPKQELFAPNIRKILECFFKYLKNDEIAVIQILSVARFYDFALFEYLMLKYPTGYPITLFDEFNKNSFVNSTGNGTYHIHEIMRNDILNITPYKLVNNIHMCILDYYNNLFFYSNSIIDKKSYIKECIFHSKYVKSKQEYVDYITHNFLTFFITLQNNGESKYLVNIFNDIFFYINKYDSIELFKIYTDMIMLNGNFKKAVEYIDDFLKKYSIKEISNSDNLLYLYVKKIKHQMVFCPLNSIIDSIDSIIPYVNKKSFPQQYSELLYTKCNMVLEKGDFLKSLEILNDLLDFSIKHNLNDMQCRIYRKLSDCYLSMKDNINSDNACEMGLKIARKFNYFRYENYLNCTKAEIYRKFKLFNKAEEEYIICREKFRNLGIEPWIAHTELGISEIKIENGNYEDAQIHLETAYNIYLKFEHEWGIIHVELLKLKCKYLKSKIIDYSKINSLINKCKLMNYESIIKELKQLLNGSLNSSNILFL